MEIKLTVVNKVMHLSPNFKPALVYKGDRFTNHFRTYNPRDAYIAHNNGGFTIAHEN